MMEFVSADLCSAGQAKSRPDTLTVGAPWRLPSSTSGNASAISRTTSKFIFIPGMKSAALPNETEILASSYFAKVAPISHGGERFNRDVDSRKRAPIE